MTLDETRWFQFGTGAMGVIIANCEGRFITADETFLKMTGYDREDVRAGHIGWEQLTPAERRESDRYTIDALTAALYAGAHERVWRQKNGSLVSVLFKVVCVEPASDLVVIHAIDVSDQRENNPTNRLIRPSVDAQFHLAAIVESSDDAIVSKSLESIITSWNKGAEKIFGYTAAEAVGKSITILIPPDRNNEEEQIISRLKLGERIDHYETVRLRKDGTEIDISLTVSPIKDANGRVIGASKIARNITERRRSEQRLQESMDRLSLALQAAHLGNWSWDTATDVVILSERAAEIFGIPVNQRITWTGLRGLLHQDDRELARTEVEKSILAHSDYDIEYRVWHQPAGQWHWIAAKGRAIYNSGGNATGMLGIVQDITERKQSREQLEEEREALEIINQLGQTLSVELDKERLVQMLTDAATNITGAQFGSFFYNVLDERGASYMLYTLSGVPREHFSHFPMPRATDLFGPTFRGEGVIRIDDVKQDARYGNNSPYYGMPEGHLPVTSYLAVPVISRSGEVIGGLFFGHSEKGVFTERQERILSGLAGQAAIAMDNARLYEATLKARADAETANRLKDEFLATVSHELRTPLNAILGWSRMLSSGKLDEPGIVRAVEIIERNAKAQGQIIEDILDVSRIITGKLRLDVSPVEIAEAIEAAVDTLRPTADARSVRLHAMLETRPSLVLGDANRLQQIVWNLLSNAIKFTPKGGRVQISLSRINSHVEILVSDTGQGISKNFLPYVFERFRQADSSPSRSYGGLGLGLAIVRHLVELHGGSVMADSPGEGGGATFTVRLPLAIMREGGNQLDSASALHLHRAAEKGISAEITTDLSGVRVLVVDDEADARELLRALLGQCGAEVRAAGSALEAIQLLKAWLPDVLVSDIGMPGRDGYALIREVRTLAATKGGNVPAIALTAYARSEDRLKALRSGFQTHIAKPVEPAELCAVVASLIRSHGYRSAEPSQ